MNKGNGELHDQTQRARALDVQTSFIVQAPAGSGKTELLIQRYLALLAHVPHAPEEILAITFTRKAAHEMLQRVQLALNSALQPAPTSPHQLTTYRLATAVLKRDQTENWHLLKNPHRLRIQTIDGLCANLVRQMPIAAKLGLYQGIIEDDNLYEKTVLEFLATVDSNEPWQAALTQVLLHLDTNIDLITRLLVDMLKKRDQWLRHIGLGQVEPKILRQQLEDTLKLVVAENLNALNQTLPHELRAELNLLIQFAVQHIPSQHPLAQCRSYPNLPAFSLAHLPYWQAVGQLLVTKQFQIRKSINVNDGFPPTHKALKTRMLALLEQLAAHEDFRLSLEIFLQSPALTYTDEQWQILWNLLQLLPILVAHLKVAFQRMGKVDYTEIALSALAALGEQDAPSDLALHLDYKIQHILVDEFQDTSIIQFHLLEKLVQSWGNDGRTLFLVGDPMQSIYRFRKAEVGLFIRAKHQGIGPIQLESLTLRTNFRSTPTIVNWINHAFERIFPTKSDIATGSIPYSPSYAPNLENEHETNIMVYPYQAINEEAIKIINIIKQTPPQASVAILVRTRSHLLEIIPALKAANINYEATEIESLSTHSVIQDLMALTRALLQLEDRIAWLSILRAPWCGLNLTDLQVVATYNTQFAVWDALIHYKELGLSSAAILCLDRIIPIFNYALSIRGHQDLANYLLHIWQLLGGPATLTKTDELIYAQAFFELVATLEQGGEIKDLSQLEIGLTRLYAPPATNTAPAVAVMTIHKAKGLEFDTVIIPSLHKTTQYDEHALMLWMERPRAQGENLLVAPLKAVASETHAEIYRYLRLIENQKNYYEIARLFYVGVTRAKRNLYLLGQLNVDADNQLIDPKSMSFIELITAQAKAAFANQTEDLPLKSSSDLNPPTKLLFQRLSLAFQSPLNLPVNRHTPALTDPADKTKFDLVNHPVGVLVHRMLQIISANFNTEWTQAQLKTYEPLWRQTLLMKGTPSNLMDKCVELILKGLMNTLTDERGRWILQSRPTAQSRITFSCYQQGQFETKMIDRTFVDEDGKRWIILFKMTALDETTVLGEEEILKYYREVKNCIKLLPPTTNPIYLGIYLPFLRFWKEWVGQNTSAQMVLF